MEKKIGGGRPGGGEGEKGRGLSIWCLVERNKGETARKGKNLPKGRRKYFGGRGEERPDLLRRSKGERKSSRKQAEREKVKGRRKHGVRGDHRRTAPFFGVSLLKRGAPLKTGAKTLLIKDRRKENYGKKERSNLPIERSQDFLRKRDKEKTSCAERAEAFSQSLGGGDKGLKKKS